MGMFSAFGESTPTRTFVVPAPPDAAVRLGASHLKTQGFSDHKWDLESALKSGVVESGWTGALLTIGTELQGFVGGCLFEMIPLLWLLTPRIQRMYSPLQVAVYARPLPSDPRLSELVFFYPNDDVQHEVAVDKKGHIIECFESFGRVARQLDVYVDGPYQVKRKDLPREHPASTVGWIMLSGQMRKAHRKKRWSKK